MIVVFPLPYLMKIGFLPSHQILIVASSSFLFVLLEPIAGTLERLEGRFCCGKNSPSFVYYLFPLTLFCSQESFSFCKFLCKAAARLRQKYLPYDVNEVIFNALFVFFLCSLAICAERSTARPITPARSCAFSSVFGFSLVVALGNKRCPVLIRPRLLCNDCRV